MNANRFFLAAALIAFLSNSLPARADDIDIYSGLSGNANIPNVMIVIDNAANAHADVASCTYSASLPFAGGLAPPESPKAMGLDKCALANIIFNLSTKSDGSALVKLGVTDMTGARVPLIPVDDKAFNNGAATTLTVSGTPITFDAQGNATVGGSVKYVCNIGTKTPCTNRQALILSIITLTEISGKTGQGAELQETWAYYTGGTGILSNLTFPGTNATSGCQKNYIIFLSNVKAGSNASHALELGELPPLDTAAKAALSANSLTLAQFNTVDPSSGSYSGAIPNKPEGGYGIEWARFMNTVDTNNGAIGTQNIVTYSVGTGDTAVPPAAITSTMETYINDVGIYGGGKYFAAGTSYTALYDDILKILNEVQAVNSVFASASLPVSVNAQGTYLNQIFMGMFRPDANGQPRWLGNLKQYQFVYTPATTTTAAGLTLSDSQPIAALSSAGTGFIAPNAISFWTNKKTGVEPDKNGGFWRNKPQGVGGGYDSPDGEVVEKGGVAQAIRTANLLGDYTTNAGTTTNPRNVATYCATPAAAGSSCDPNLLGPTNLFASTNIPAGSFNPSNIRISSIVRTGTSALVTTSSPHGFATGTTVSISGASPADYNVTQSVTVNSSTTFTITGLGDYPTTASQGTYTASTQAGPQLSISSISVNTSTAANSNTNPCATGTIPNVNCNQVTVTVPNSYSNGNTVTIAGVLPRDYIGSFVIANVTTSSFTYNVPVIPTSPSANTYSAQLSSATISRVTVSGNGVNTTATVTATNSFRAGDSVTISGSSIAADNGTFTVASATLTSFTILSRTMVLCNSVCGYANYPTISITAGSISRTTATTATVANVTANAFSNGQTVNLRQVSGTSSNENAYVPIGGAKTVTISCSSPCTSFTFPISAMPSTTTLTTSSPTAQLGLATSIPVGAITRTGGTATVSGVTNGFTNGQSITIGASGTAYANESAYLGTWTIACAALGCNPFTFGPVTLTPTSPASGTMSAYSGTAPDEKTIVNWVRGMDNAGDEPSPDPTYSTINVRGSVHGDVLHARPAVINYGGTIGSVVFYGANDGMYRAINGNQPNATPNSIGSTAPGNELWSFVPPEFIGELTRLRDNSPLLQLPTTPPGITPTPAQKTYFADGSTGVYQKLNTDGTTNDAYIYLSMRRGGNFLYALHVQDPTKPVFAWRINQSGLTYGTTTTASTDFAELGQTWSQPKVALVRGYANPVLIFGAGYDPTEDSEPPGTDSSGRGIFIVDAFTGSLVWRVTVGASDGCSGAICTKANMKWSIPSDISLIDKNSDGYVDRLYASDTGGNIWRVDLEPNGYSSISTANPPSSWRATQLAALGCSSGMCASGTTPRKFFYPPDVVPNGNASPQYDAVVIGSGDREHPLYSSPSYSVVNRFYMVKDPNINSTSTDQYTNNNEAKLTDITPVAPATTTAYDNSLNGYYLTFGTGEKAVNAPTTVAGYTYFGTNTPATPTSNSCTTNLGVAKGYAITPFGGVATSTTYAGGGLPPTTVAGVVNVSYVDSAGVTQNVQSAFCIGCGGLTTAPTNCNSSAIGACRPQITVPKNRRKQYWSIDNR